MNKFVHRVGLVSWTRFLRQSVELVRCVLERSESDSIAPFSFDESCEESIWT